MKFREYFQLSEKGSNSRRTKRSLVVIQWQTLEIIIREKIVTCNSLFIFDTCRRRLVSAKIDLIWRVTKLWLLICHLVYFVLVLSICSLSPAEPLLCSLRTSIFVFLWFARSKMLCQVFIMCACAFSKFWIFSI